MHEGLYGADAVLAQISQRFKRLPVEPLRRSTPPRAGDMARRAVRL